MEESSIPAEGLIQTEIPSTAAASDEVMSPAPSNLVLSLTEEPTFTNSLSAYVELDSALEEQPSADQTEDLNAVLVEPVNDAYANILMCDASMLSATANEDMDYSIDSSCNQSSVLLTTSLIYPQRHFRS